MTLGITATRKSYLALNSQRLLGMWLGLIQLDPNPVLKKRSTLKGELRHFSLGLQVFQTFASLTDNDYALRLTGYRRYPM